MTAKARGKSYEQRCAEVYGGQRVSTTVTDVVTPTLVIEAKRGYGTDAVRDAWITQGKKACKKIGRPWLVVHAQKGSPEGTVTMSEKLALHLLRNAGMIPDRAEEE